MHDQGMIANYENQTRLTLAGGDEILSKQELANRFERDHTVKWAPSFEEQVTDTDRGNVFAYFEGRKPESFMDIYQKIQEDGEKLSFSSEQVALSGLRRFIDAHIAQEHADKNLAHMVDSFEDELVFIGEKEYQEATQGIAEYWKYELRRNKKLQLCVPTVVTDLYQSDRERPVVKSDSFMLDRILAHFSDEELAEFRGRLHLTVESLDGSQPGDTKIVMLDDWTISGEQLQRARYHFLAENPQYEPSLEIQLIVGREEDIRLGFAKPDPSGETRPATPVRAYYAVPESKNEVRMTGIHSSVDYGFRHDLTRLALAAAEQDVSDQVAITPPALANIKRPYRMDDYKFENIDRLRQLTDK